MKYVDAEQVQKNMGTRLFKNKLAKALFLVVDSLFTGHIGYFDL